MMPKKSISSAGDSPARTFRRQENGPALRAPEASFGVSSRASFASFDRATSSWKTSQILLFEDSTSSSVIWPLAGTMRNGQAFERLTLELPTNRVGVSSSWPTPCTTDAKDAARSTTTTGIMHAGTTLTDAVRAFYGPHPPMPLTKAGFRGAESVVVVPEFVEALMGLPRDWTLVADGDASGILETP